MQGVAANFRQIFAALVPSGRGELVMIKQARKRAREEAAEEAAQDEGDSDGGEGQSVLEKYSGVAVKVSTPNKRIFNLAQTRNDGYCVTA